MTQAGIPLQRVIICDSEKRNRHSGTVMQEKEGGGTMMATVGMQGVGQKSEETKMKKK